MGGEPPLTPVAIDTAAVTGDSAGDHDTGRSFPGQGTPLEAFWTTVKRMPRYAPLIAGLVKDGRIPKSAKAGLIVGGAYAVSPIDLVPGIIPVIGQLDDLFVLLMAVRHAVRSAPPGVAEVHLERAGITEAEIETDLATVKATAKWLVVRGARAGGKAAMSGARRLRSLVRPRG
ncbi:MAG: DUF1232 domain-containing protein [Thermomicrobiales bacterium]